MKVANYHGYVAYNQRRKPNCVRISFGGMGATNSHRSSSPGLSEAPGRRLPTRFSTTWGAGIKANSDPAVGVRWARSDACLCQTDAAGYWCDPYWGLLLAGDRSEPVGRDGRHLGQVLRGMILRIDYTPQRLRPVTVRRRRGPNRHAAASVTATFTIAAIDHAARIVTLMDKNGNYDEILCGPDVQRFDALKVGDTVTFTYVESVVSAIHRPEPGTPAKPAASAGITRTPGASPGGTVSQQKTVLVTIAAIDAKTPAVTITTEQGHKMSFKVENAKNLEGYKVGTRSKSPTPRPSRSGGLPASGASPF